MKAEHRIVQGDCLEVLRGMKPGSVDLIYIDPPFNTGSERRMDRLKVRSAQTGRLGFSGRRYETEKAGSLAYADAFDDYLGGFLEPRLREAHRVLSPKGTMYVHLGWREVHYVKVLLDGIFGRGSFLNEIVWAWDYGGKTKRRWPPKHDDLLVYVKNPRSYTFNSAAVDRIPYMAPKLAGPQKAAFGKLPTDAWWHTIVPTSGPERTGYPTQKPLGILRRIVAASSKPGDLVMDFFAGSGTTGAACLELGRRFVLVDANPAAMRVMKRRFVGVGGISWGRAAS